MAMLLIKDHPLLWNSTNDSVVGQDSIVVVWDNRAV